MFNFVKSIKETMETVNYAIREFKETPLDQPVFQEGWKNKWNGVNLKQRKIVLEAQEAAKKAKVEAEEAWNDVQIAIQEQMDAREKLVDLEEKLQDAQTEVEKAQIKESKFIKEWAKEDKERINKINNIVTQKISDIIDKMQLHKEIEQLKQAIKDNCDEDCWDLCKIAIGTKGIAFYDGYYNGEPLYIYVINGEVCVDNPHMSAEYYGDNDNEDNYDIGKIIINGYTTYNELYEQNPIDTEELRKATRITEEAIKKVQTFNQSIEDVTEIIKNIEKEVGDAYDYYAVIKSIADEKTKKAAELKDSLNIKPVASTNIFVVLLNKVRMGIKKLIDAGEKACPFLKK